MTTNNQGRQEDPDKLWEMINKLEAENWRMKTVLRQLLSLQETLQELRHEL